MDVFEAVAEPSRRALLDALSGGERSAGELVATLPSLSQPTVSRHLRVLREVGLVEVRSDAQRRIYALRADGLSRHFERRPPFPVEKVWLAITDPIHRDQWMGKTVIEPREGGRIETVA